MENLKIEFIERTLPDGRTQVQVVAVLATLEHERAEVARDAAHDWVRSYERATGQGTL